MPGDLRAVVVGCGRIGSTLAAAARFPGVHAHAQAYATHPRFHLAGLSDADAAKREAAAALWGAPAFEDPVAACKTLAADVVSICTPDETHASIATRILQETPPRLLFVEKPLALSSAQARDLLALARKQGCSVAVNYPRRFSPAFRAVRAELASGELGRPLLLRILYGKGLLHNGSHAIDLIRFWLGEPTRATGEPRAPGPEGDATYDAELWFEGGTRAKLDAFDETHATVFEGDLLTTSARVRFTLGGNAWEFFQTDESALYHGYRSFVPTARSREDVRFHSPLGECLPRALDEIAAHIHDGAPLSCTGEDGLRALQWVERIRGSA